MTQTRHRRADSVPMKPMPPKMRVVREGSESRSLKIWTGGYQPVGKFNKVDAAFIKGMIWGILTATCAIGFLLAVVKP